MAALPIHLNTRTTVYQRTKIEQDNQQKYLKYIHVLYHRILNIFFSIFVIHVIIQTFCSAESKINKQHPASVAFCFESNVCKITIKLKNKEKLCFHTRN